VLSSHIILCLPSVHIFQVFAPKFHICSSPSPARATCHTHLVLLYLICRTIFCAAQIVQLISLGTQISVFSCDQSVNKIKTKTVETCSYIKQYHSFSCVSLPINFLSTQLSNAPSHLVSLLYTSHISHRSDDALSPYLFQCYCAQRTFQAIRFTGEPTGFLFMAVEEPNGVGGWADSVRKASQTVYMSCFVRQPALAVAVHETLDLYVQKQITRSRQITSCRLDYLKTIALSELTNCLTVISWPRTCITYRLLLMQPSHLKLSELHLCFIIRPSPPPPPKKKSCSLALIVNKNSSELFQLSAATTAQCSLSYCCNVLRTGVSTETHSRVLNVVRGGDCAG
jgi:hypothetical protein